MHELLKLLNHPEAGSVERLQFYEIWHLLLLVKWTILYGRSVHRRHLKSVTEIEIRQLVNLTKDLGNHVRDIGSIDDVFLFMRSLAYQQLWTQQREYFPDEIARQYLLFGSLEQNHTFCKAFRKVTGVSIADFLELSMVLFTKILADNEPFISESYFATIESRYDSKTIPSFLSTLSKTLPEAREWLNRENQDIPEKYRSVEYEYFEPTPLLRHPLIRISNQYCIISPELLFESLSTYVYDSLRRDNAQVFMNRFGPMFESLVGRSITSVENAVLTEDDLKRHFGNSADQQVVDYLVVENDCNIFIEAKAVAMSLPGMVTDRPGTVRAQTKASVIKGIEQGISLAHALGNGANVGGIKTGTKENYLLIVTFKELYVGNGQQFRDVFAANEIDRILRQHEDAQFLPLSNIFIVSINDFDALLGSIHRGPRSLIDYIEDAVLLVKSTGAWTPFRNTIFQEGEGFATLPYLHESLDELMDNLKQKLKT